MKNSILFLFFTISYSIISQENKTELLSYKFTVDSLYSTNIQDYRTVKIFLPNEYSKDVKYPVIYALDAQWMFEPTVAESKILMDFDVIPQSIIVGVFHKNRNDDLGIDWNTGAFNQNSLKFYNFLTQELLTKINSTYSTSGFNTLVGHSNSATFCENVITQQEHYFNGFVALSQNLFGNQLQEYIKLTNQSQSKPIFYFVASGKRDATSRLESGMKLDSLFKINKNSNIKSKHILYDADHDGIVAKGLNNGISHIFSEYKHYNDWDEKRIDSLLAKNISSLDFINQHSERMKEIYGIDFKVNYNDVTLMQVIARNDIDIESVMNYEIEHIGKSNDFYSGYAQEFEFLKSYEKALEYWVINLEENNKKIKNFFYYRRPIELLSIKMVQPKRAIEFAEKWKGKAPRFSSEFNLRIAEIALENNIKIKVGLESIREYIENHKEGLSTDLEKAKEIEQKLEEHRNSKN